MKTIDYIKKGLKNIGADDFVIEYINGNSEQIKFANNQIVENTTWLSANITIFAAIKKRIISTVINDLTKESAEGAIKKIAKFSRMIEPNSEYMGIAQGPFKYKKIEGCFDKKVISVNSDELVESAINKALQCGAKRVAGVLEKSSGELALTTSGGVDALEKGTHVYLSLRALAEKDASGHKVCVSRTMKGFDVEKTAEDAAIIAKNAMNPEQGKPGMYDVIFEPLPFANLLTTVGSSASIFNVESGLSFLQDKISKKVASSKFSLIDDPTMPGGFGSMRFDEEGVPTQRNAIIEDGILKTYLHNTSTAKRHKTKTTANAGLIAPRAINLYLKEGSMDKDEMIKNVKNGLIVTNVWYTRFQNYATGDFSTIPRDGIFYIKNGKILGAVKDIRISDSMMNIMKNCAEICRQSSQVMGWEVDTPVKLAPVLVKNVRVTKSTQ